MFSNILQYLNPGAAMQSAAEMYKANAGANASMYGAYYQGLGDLGKSAAAERAGLYGANAMAEAARQSAAGSIGSAALGAYGSASNAAMGAWANNQMAYNKSLSDMTAANQTSLAGYGNGRNSALASLADPYAKTGLGFAALSSMDPGYGGGSFYAGGVDGGLAAGSYGGTASGSRAAGVDSRPTMASLDALRNGITSDGTAGALNSNYQDAMGRLEQQHYSSRQQPSQMMDQTLQGLLTMSREGYGQSNSGMNQFYDQQRTAGNQFMDVLGGLRTDMKSRAPTGGEFNFGSMFGSPAAPPQQKKPSFVGYVPYNQSGFSASGGRWGAPAASSPAVKPGARG